MHAKVKIMRTSQTIILLSVFIFVIYYIILQNAPSVKDYFKISKLFFYFLKIFSVFRAIFLKILIFFA